MAHPISVTESYAVAQNVHLQVELEEERDRRQKAESDRDILRDTLISWQKRTLVWHKHSPPYNSDEIIITYKNGNEDVDLTARCGYWFHLDFKIIPGNARLPQG